MLRTIGANEVKRGLNYSDKLLPFGYKRLITKQLREIFYYECIIGSAVTVSAFTMITNPLSLVFYYLLKQGLLLRQFARPQGSV